MPWLARRLLSPLQRLAIRGPAVDLALRRLWGAPSQVAVALCGIVASTSLMIAMATMVASFRGSVDEWLVQVLPADVYLNVEAPGFGFDPAAQAALRAVPGVASIRFVVSTPLRLAPDRPPVALLGQDVDPANPGRIIPLIDRKSTRLNSSHANISYAVICLKKKRKKPSPLTRLNPKPRARASPR